MLLHLRARRTDSEPALWGEPCIPAKLARGLYSRSMSRGTLRDDANGSPSTDQLYRSKRPQREVETNADEVAELALMPVQPANASRGSSGPDRIPSREIFL